MKTMDKGEQSYYRYIQGDKNAFSEVLDIYREGLIFFINRFVGNLDIAEDIAADCFVELIVNPKRYNFSSSLKTYLFTIAHNKAVNFVRKNIRICPLPFDVACQKSTEYECFENEIFLNERKKLLNTAMLKIKSDYRTALHLIYFEDMSYKEAARVMKKTSKQIDNLVARGKTALKKELEKEGFTYED